MPGISERAVSLFYRMAVSGALPVAWFRDVDPASVTRAKKTGKLKLEIVSHCWRYGHFLTYQLSSLVNHRTRKFDITMTVFHVPEDELVTRESPARIDHRLCAAVGRWAHRECRWLR
jgi:hypothetical protein